MNSAMPMLSGTAKISAEIEVTNVPKRNGEHPELALARRPTGREQEPGGVVAEDRPRLFAGRPRDENEDDEHGQASGQRR